MNQSSLFPAGMERGAVFSPCRTWRYVLTRTWEPSAPLCVFIGLNPSTADELLDDPTVRRCIGFAKHWGCGRFVMLNLFAFRSTDPRTMKRSADPIGPDNDRWLLYWHQQSDMTIAGWGNHGKYRERAHAVLRFLTTHKPVQCLGVTKQGLPKHPLYLKRFLKPLDYSFPPAT